MSQMRNTWWEFLQAEHGANFTLMLEVLQRPYLIKYLISVLCRSEPSKTHYREMHSSVPSVPDRVN